MRTCKNCGVNIDGKRANAEFCTPACRKVWHRRVHRGYPHEMFSVDRWVCWRYVRRGNRWTKLPVRPNGSPASSTDSRTWTSYKAARKASDRVGFVLGAGIGCIDFDHCVVDGVLDPVLVDLLKRCPDTFVEFSPSGEGVHVWGLLPEGAGRRFVRRDGLSVEIYSVGRYVTFTGKSLPCSFGKLADLSGFVDVLLT